MNKEKLKSYLTLRNILFTVAGIFIVSCLWFYFSLPDVSYLKNENPKITALMELRQEQAAEANKKFRIINIIV